MEIKKRINTGRTSSFLKKRMVFILVFMSFLFFAVILRLFYLQVIADDQLKAKAQSQQMRQIPVEASRGVIYDTEGKVLAVSVSADSVYAIPTEISAEEAPAMAKVLAETLDMEEATVLKKLTSGRSFEWLKRKVDASIAEEILALNYTGIEATTETKRSYPKDNLASHILGFVGIDNQGLEGIEVIREEDLAGENGFVLAQYDSHGQEIAGSSRTYVEPENGNSLVLTIDETIQYFCERELDNLMNSNVNPAAATIIVMRPDTGEILALANRPDYDPNSFQDYDSSLWRNRAVSDVYEPGSTSKIMTLAAALEEGVVTETDTFYDPGYINVGTEKIRCWSTTPHGSQTLVEVVENSCNPCFVEIGQRIDAQEEDTFYNYLTSFGYGEITGIELPGEAEGILRDFEDCVPLDIANMYIGQALAVTPIQLITAASAAVNGGVLMKPQIVKEVLDADGNVIEAFEPVEVRRVVSEETSERLNALLESVVANGTGSKAYIEGYRVGGKTGTAQKFIDGAYSSSKYVASFLGVAPVNDPEIVCLVIIDEPGNYPWYGGTIAAPVFKNVVEDTLQYLSVKPQLSEVEEGAGDDSIKETESEKTVRVPSVVGLETAEAEKILEEAGFEVTVKGDGGVVVKQVPAALVEESTGTGVLLELGTSATTDVTLPDLNGRRILECSEILSALGLVFEPVGYGTAVSQEPVANTVLKRGATVTVNFDSEAGDPIETLAP